MADKRTDVFSGLQRIPARRRRERRSVINGLQRVSSPGRRVYVGKREIPWVLSGLGVSIVTTSRGVMTDQKARQLGLGGELLCKVW